MAEESVRLDGHEIALSHLDRVLFPKQGLTKGDLIEYYRRIAPVALPHLAERPLTLQRFPEGIRGEGFFQKHLPDHFPDWFARAELPKEGGRMTYAVLSNAASLVYVANQGCITPHIGLSRVDRIDRPDRLVFDLDPSDGDFAKVQDAAARVRALLDELGIVPFVMTTGSRGLHVVVALDRTGDFDAARTFARDCCEILARRFPDRLTVEQRKAKRGNRVFLDYLRNAYGQTAVGAYGVRARPGAPVATPLEWEEVGKSKLRPDRFTIRNLFRRLGQRDDPWSRIARHAVSVETCANRLAKLGDIEKTQG